MHRQQRDLLSEEKICQENATEPFARSDGSTQQLLQDFLQANATSLLGIVRSYVQRMGLASGDRVPGAALEILQEMAMEALAHAKRFNPQGQPMAWLLGIAMNIIRRKKVENAKRYQREELLGALVKRYPDLPNESDVLDHIASPTTPELAQIVESDEQVTALLALVSPEDQHILRLALLDEYKHQDLAQKLGISTGAARMRLHRALSRLRTAWKEQQHSQQEGGKHG